jgi:hypothetical protein
MEADGTSAALSVAMNACWCRASQYLLTKTAVLVARRVVSDGV